jgi:hypothetical protein
MGRRHIPGTTPVLISMPAELHALLKSDAEEHADTKGGHVNISRAAVVRIYESCADRLSLDDRKKVEALLKRL